MSGTQRSSAERQRHVRLQLFIPAEELAAIDAYRFAQRSPNRAAAIRELLKRGLSERLTSVRCPED